MQINIKQPETVDEFKHYYQLRWTLLRAPWNQPEGSEVDALEDQCFHVMATTDSNEVIGVARLQYNNDSEAQIRYMAVAKALERKGIGRELMIAMERHAINLNYKEVILDARELAVGFYEKLGYTVVEKSYLLFGEIQHYRMKKKLIHSHAIR